MKYKKEQEKVRLREEAGVRLQRTLDAILSLGCILREWRTLESRNVARTDLHFRKVVLR